MELATHNVKKEERKGTNEIKEDNALDFQALENLKQMERSSCF